MNAPEAGAGVDAGEGDILVVRDLHAFYGKSHVLRGLDLRLAPGEIVALLGRNGAGRSTAVRAIMGAVERRGSVRFRGEEITGLEPHRIARLGLGYVPENRDVFPSLTVRENLVLGEKRGPGSPRWTIEDSFALFPRLRERAGTAAGVLSGGEQQLLTMCRTLMGNPSLLMVDEPTEGLAPQMVRVVGDFLKGVAERGVAVLLVEQKLSIALRISRRVYVMGHGRIVFEGSPADLEDDAAVRREWLEV